MSALISHSTIPITFIFVVVRDRVTGVCCHNHALSLLGVEGLDSVPHPSTAGTLSTEPSLQPHNLIFKGAVAGQSLNSTTSVSTEHQTQREIGGMGRLEGEEH